MHHLRYLTTSGHWHTIKASPNRVDLTTERDKFVSHGVDVKRFSIIPEVVASEVVKPFMERDASSLVTFLTIVIVLTGIMAAAAFFSI